MIYNTYSLIYLTDLNETDFWKEKAETDRQTERQRERHHFSQASSLMNFLYRIETMITLIFL
jgi:hypothetical protein